MAGGGIPYTPADFNQVVQTVAGEAGDQPPAGQAAVASTILNRHSLTGKPIGAIAADASQYNGAESENARAASPGSPTYKAIAANIQPVFDGGPTTSATHFYAPKLVKAPGWAQGRGDQIGDHVFYDRSDLLGDKPPPVADVISRANAQAPGEHVIASGKGITISVGGPDPAAPADDDAPPPIGDVLNRAGLPGIGAPAGPPPTPAQIAANKDAGILNDAATKGLHLALHGPYGTGDVNTEAPLLHGMSQGFGDELAGKVFAGVTGLRNAFGAHLPYGMKEADAAMTGASRGTLAQIAAEHPIVSAGAELAGTALPWVLGGEALGAGTSAPEAVSSLGRLAQTGGKVLVGGTKGAALGAAGGALTAAGNAEGSADDRLTAAGHGAEVGGVLGAGLGAAAPVVLPPVASALGYLGREAEAAYGAGAQKVINTANALTGRPAETSAAEYFASKSPTAQAVKGALAPQDVAETVEPTAQEAQAAQQKLRTMMAANGKTAEHLQNVPGDLPYTTAEALGSQTVNHAASLSRRAGTTPDAAVTQIGERAQNFGRSILDEFSTATGVHPEEAGGNVEGLVTRLRSDADPLFAAVRAHEGPVWNDDLAQMARRPVVQRALASAADDLRNAGKDPSAVEWIIKQTASPREVQPGRVIASPPTTTETAAPVSRPTAETWEMIRQRIGDQVERNPLTGKIVPDSQSRGNYNINVAKRDLTGVLAGDGKSPGLIPGYRDALDKAGDYQSVQSAFDRGKGALLTDKVTAKDFAKTYAGLSDGEKQAWTAGVANQLFERSQTRAGLTQSLLKSPNFQAKLRTVMGDQADAFIDRMTQRIRLQNTGNRILPGAGSQTAPLGMAAAESAPVGDALGSFLKDAAHAKASPLTFIAKKGLAHALSDRAANISETPGYRNAYGRLLLQHPNETAAELLRGPQITPRMLAPTRARLSALGAYVGGQVGRGGQ